MNDQKSFCEYTVTPEPSFAVKLGRVGLLTLYTLLTVIWLYIFALVSLTWVMLLLLPFVLYALITLTWRYVRYDFEYAVEGGELTISKIFDGRSRRTVYRAEIADFVKVLPYLEEKAILTSGEFADVAEFTACEESESAWIGILNDKKSGKRKAVIFEASPDMLRLMRHSNPSALHAARLNG